MFGEESIFDKNNLYNYSATADFIKTTLYIIPVYYLK